MNQPLVSVIVPTYNVERYIDDCLESIQAQTYSNLETIVIDDGSSDATPYLLKPFENTMNVHYNKDNQGQGTVRNEGIGKAQGKYILFVDSDDWIEPVTIEKLVEKAEETNVDLVRFNGKTFFEGEGKTPLDGQYNFGKVLEEKVYDQIESLKLNQKAYSASPCLYLIKKNILDRHSLRFPEGVLHEDEYFTTMLFTHVKRMTFINQFFYHRRYRVASTMTEITPAHRRRSFDSYMEVFKRLEKEYQTDKFSKAQKAFIKRQMLSVYRGMKTSDMPAVLKKDLGKLNSVTLSDRLRLILSDGLRKLKER